MDLLLRWCLAQQRKLSTSSAAHQGPFVKPERPLLLGYGLEGRSSSSWGASKPTH